jgi:hypothetical protein
LQTPLRPWSLDRFSIWQSSWMGSSNTIPAALQQPSWVTARVQLFCPSRRFWGIRRPVDRNPLVLPEAQRRGLWELCMGMGGTCFDLRFFFYCCKKVHVYYGHRIYFLIPWISSLELEILTNCGFKKLYIFCRSAAFQKSKGMKCSSRY